jgi:hypothetical protein
MYEARIFYKDGRHNVVEANTLEMLKSKCANYISSLGVYSIVVVKIESIGYFKSDIAKMPLL